MNELVSKTKNKNSSWAHNEVMFLLVQVGHAVERRLEEALERVGLSGAKFGALAQLVETDEMLALSDLAARLTCVRSNITQLVDRLEADGLVKREEYPTDRRAVRAAVTDFGRERYAAGARQVEEVRKALARVLSGIDGKSLEHVLATLK
ncbi:MAG: MarR family winged helix-turn-helix transcriptional regulator [Nitrospiria bacterium]